MSRYQELQNLVAGLKPDRILEIGTWNGDRAIALCAYGAEYVGFDLFEEATDETDEREKNVKAHHTLGEVAQKLADADIVHTLVRGDTRTTLPEWCDGATKPFDFVWIDGGHSVETIESDWACVKELTRPGSVVVFDDYYEGVEGEVGCNDIVDRLENVTFSPSADKVKGGGTVRWAAVMIG